MTDPRIEAAAWMIGSVSDLAPGGDWEKLAPHQKTHFRRLAKAVLKSADAAAWRPTTAPPDAGILVHIASSAETGAKRAIALWDYDMGCWHDPDLGMRYAPAYFPHWQPLPTPPNATPQAAPDTITILEVRNDRPIPGKEGADG